MSTRQIQMAGRPRYTAARLPHLLEHDALANRLAQLRMEHRRLAHLYDRYEDDEDLALPRHRNTRHGGDQRRTDIGVANPDRAFYPPSEPLYNDLDSHESGRHHLYSGGRLSDSTNEDFVFDRDRRRLHHGPPRYNPAADRSVFDDGRYSGFRGLPLPASNMETRGFDGEIFRAFSPDLRYSHPPLGSLESHDIDPDRLRDLESRLRRSAYPIFYPTHDGLDPEPSMDSHDFGRVGTRAAGRSHLAYHFDDAFKDDDLDENFREIPPSFRPCRSGHRSDLDFRFVDDKSEDEPSGELRAPIATGRRHRISRVQGCGGIDAEEPDAEDREWKRQEAQIEQRYTEENSDIDEIANVHLRDEGGRVPRAARSRPAANLSEDDLEESPRGRRGRPSRPRQAGNRRNSRRNPRTKVKIDGSAGRTDTQQAPPSYESVTPAQGVARVQAKPSNNSHHTPVASAVPNNTHFHPGPLAAIKANKTFESTAKEILHAQQQFLASVSQAKSRKTNHDIAGVESKNHGSDSSDSGCDTPDEGSEKSRAGDEISQGVDDLQTFIHITL